MSERLGTCPNCKKRPFYEDTRICACGHNLQAEVERALAAKGLKPTVPGTEHHPQHVPWKGGGEEQSEDTTDAAAMVSGVVLSRATGRPVAGAMVVMSMDDEVIARLATSQFGEFRHFFGKPHAKSRAIHFSVEHQGYDPLSHDAQFEGKPLHVELLLAGKGKGTQPPATPPKKDDGKPKPPQPPAEETLGDRISQWVMANWKIVLAVLIVLVILVGWFSARPAKANESADRHARRSLVTSPSFNLPTDRVREQLRQLGSP